MRCGKNNHGNYLDYNGYLFGDKLIRFETPADRGEGHMRCSSGSHYVTSHPSDMSQFLALESNNLRIQTLFRVYYMNIESRLLVKYMFGNKLV